MSAILSKVQKAIATHLATVDLDPIDESTNIFRGIGNDSMTLPCVVVDARSADASANYGKLVRANGDKLIDHSALFVFVGVTAKNIAEQERNLLHEAAR